MTKHVQWDGNLNQEGFEILKGDVDVSLHQLKLVILL